VSTFAGNLSLIAICAAAPVAIIAYFLTRPRTTSRRALFWFDFAILVAETIAVSWILLQVLTMPNHHEGGEIFVATVVAILCVPILIGGALLRWIIFRPTTNSEHNL
jgi:hypothetical protein